MIGFGYVFTFLLRGRRRGVQIAVIGGIFVLDWLMFVLYPAPGPSFDWQAVAVPDTVPKLTGFFAHWNKNANVAYAFDQWFLGLFPRVKPYVTSDGWQTLNFIPSMGTMLLGLMAGEMLRRMDLLMREKFLRLVFAGLICCLVGYLLGEQVLPSVKRIWTPTWTIYSTGWTFLMLAAFFAVIDWAEFQRWCFPLLVVGMNSIAVYCMAQLLKPWVKHTLARHLEFNADGRYFGMKLIGANFAPLLDAVAFTLVVWLIALWMYRRKIFIKI